jgi:sugar lactone lactonase YvrE
MAAAPGAGVRHLSAELADRAGARLGEGPAWDAARGELVWVDILSGLVVRTAEGGSRLGVLEVGVHVGAVLPAQGGGWLLAAVDGFRFLHRDGTCEHVLPVEHDRPDLRFNDGKCDPAGRALAGSMRYDEQPGHATLYRLDNGPVAVPLLTAQGLCNGLGWSPDGLTFYYNDTLTGAVAVYRYDPASGDLGPGRQLVHVDETLGAPDGLCVDDSGAIWIALWGGGAVHRYRPDGTLDTVIRLPVPHVTSVAFGGAHADRLYITTAGGAGVGGPAGDGAGALYVAEPGITGPPATPWRPVAGTEAIAEEVPDHRRHHDDGGA